jgi:hypothetical protein
MLFVLRRGPPRRRSEHRKYRRFCNAERGNVSLREDLSRCNVKGPGVTQFESISFTPSQYRPPEFSCLKPRSSIFCDRRRCERRYPPLRFAELFVRFVEVAVGNAVVGGDDVLT